MDLFNTDSASFDEPVSMLLACHDKVKRFCRQLNALPAHVAAHGMDAAAQQAVVQIRRYFNQAAPLHHLDEEADFFPLLRQYCPEAAADLDFLQAQHDVLHQTWAKLDAHLQALASGSLNIVDADLIARYTGLYAQHTAIEEPWFARGQAAIDAEKMAAIGKNMAARRKV